VRIEIWFSVSANCISVFWTTHLFGPTGDDDGNAFCDDDEGHIEDGTMATSNSSVKNGQTIHRFQFIYFRSKMLLKGFLIPITYICKLSKLLITYFHQVYSVQAA